MNPEEATFFQQLGCSQQQILSFEERRRASPRSPISPRPSASLPEEFLGTQTPPAKRDPTPKLQQQLEQLSQLPRNQQRFVSQMLDTVLQRAER